MVCRFRRGSTEVQRRVDAHFETNGVGLPNALEIAYCKLNLGRNVRGLILIRHDSAVL